MEAQRDECGARILLGDKTGGGAGGFIVLEFGFQLDSLVYMCMYIYIYIYIYILEITQYPITIYAKFRFVPDIPGDNCCVSRRRVCVLD